jgi:hypothetical protein
MHRRPQAYIETDASPPRHFAYGLESRIVNNFAQLGDSYFLIIIPDDGPDDIRSSLQVFLASP